MISPSQMDRVQKLTSIVSASGGTSLVTYYISSTTSLQSAKDRLQRELQSAYNIKSKNVRTDVIIALKSALEHFPCSPSGTGYLILSGVTQPFI